MKFALFASACFIAFTAAFGFIFGQLVFNFFSLPKSIAGAAGLVSASASFAMSTGARWAPRWVVRASALTLLGIGLDAGDFYLHLDRYGNYYPWDLITPFAACLAFVAYVALRGGLISERET